MKFGQRKSYSKGDRVWVKGQRSMGVATVMAIHPFRRNSVGVILRDFAYTLKFDRDQRPISAFYAQGLKPATELESQRSRDAAVDLHIRTIREGKP